eukprot:792605-Alexandrium_andersonii.AAC.1
MPPQSSQENANYAISFLKMVARLSLKGAFPQEWEIMAEHFELAAVKNFAMFKANGHGAAI